MRLALFFEQRRDHHFGEVPSGDPASYVRALIGAIGEAVAQARSSEPTGIPPASADVQQRFEQLGIELPPVPVRFAGDLRAFEVSPTGKGPDADQ